MTLRLGVIVACLWAPPAGAAAGHFSDTWEFDGIAWSLRSANGLPARSGLALAYDTAGQRMLAFGGFADNGPTNDVWSWDGVRWTRLF